MAEPTARPRWQRFVIDLDPEDARAIDVLAVGQGITRYRWLRRAVWAAMRREGIEPAQPTEGNAVRTVVKAGTTW